MPHTTSWLPLHQLLYLIESTCTHDLATIQLVRCHESGLLLIWLEHRYLVVPEECIYEREHLMPSSGINYLIYSGQWKTILRASVVQVDVINIDSPLFSIFWNNHYVRQPTWIFHFSHKSICQQLVHLGLDDFLSIWVEASDLPADGSQGIYAIELMWGYWWVDSGHIRVSLCKDVFILPKPTFKGF